MLALHRACRVQARYFFGPPGSGFTYDCIRMGLKSQENEELAALYLEMLDRRGLRERFKAAHRMIDVKAAQEKLRGDALENVRRAARLLAGEREDPNIDHRVLIQGSVPGVVVPTPS